jgi:hypothetical protein
MLKDFLMPEIKELIDQKKWYEIKEVISNGLPLTLLT